MFPLKLMHRKEACITIIGGGLAGCEAAWQAAQQGVLVCLYEMKPQRFSAAHEIGELAELVCSNSLRAAKIESAVGLLKEEMRRLGSLIMEAADATAVPAGAALAVDRGRFAAWVTEKIEQHPAIRVVRQEQSLLPQTDSRNPLIIAAGPLATMEISSALALADVFISFVLKGGSSSLSNLSKRSAVIKPRR